VTTGNPQPSVLVLGKSQTVLDATVAALREAGYTAHVTSDFTSDITRQFDITAVDLVLVGTQVPPSRRAELKEEIAAVNPRVIFVQGLAGIPGLIVNQVRGAFAAAQQDPAHAPSYSPADRLIRLTVPDPADVTVTAWWRAPSVPPDLKSDSLVLLDGPLGRGDYTIPVPEHVFRPAHGTAGPPHARLAPPQPAFATVRVGTAIYAFSITAGPFLPRPGCLDHL
jgi:hypothetical protein